MPHPKVKIADNDGNTVDVTSNRLDVNAYLSAGSVNVGDIDVLSVVPGTGTTNLGKAEDASHISGSTGVMSLGVRTDIIGSSLVDSVGDYAPFQVSASGALYVTGSEIENAAVQSEPLLIGGRYDSSARTLGSGDAGAVALNASGHVLMDVVDGGQLDTIVDTLETTLTAIETDIAANEVLLGTIDSDTDAIKTAAELIADTIGDDGSVGPAKCVSIGGTYVGSMQEIQVDSSGHLQVDVLTAPSTAVTNAGTFVVQEDGAALTALQIMDDWDATHDSSVSADGVQIMGEAKVVDGSTLPNVVAEGDAARLAVTRSGILYTTLTDDSGLKRVVVKDDSEQGSAPGMINVGGEYRLSATTYADGDATILQTNVNGALKVDCNGSDVTVDNFPTWLTVAAGNGASPVHSNAETWVASDDGFNILATCSTTLAALTNVGNGEYTSLQVDTQGALYTTHAMTGMQSDNNEGVDDSTAEVLKSSTACKRVDMQADPSNTGYIYVGGSDVSATKGIRLAPGDFYSIDVDNTADIYVLASVDEEDIHFTYFT